MVFQNYALYPHMSVYDKIGFALKLASVTKDEIDRRVREAAGILELDEQLGRKPAQLSGGHRQSRRHHRLRHPRPGRGDDDGGPVAALKDGFLQQVDTPQTLYDRPANVFVAAFIGSPSMNLLEASIDGDELVLGPHRLALPAEVFADRPALRSFDGKPVIVGIRPEDIDDPDTGPEQGGWPRLPTTVSLVEALGSELVFHFSIDAPPVDAGDPDAVDELGSGANAVGRFSPRSTVQVDDDTEIAVNTLRLHFFDPAERTSIWE